MADGTYNDECNQEKQLEQLSPCVQKGNMWNIIFFFYCWRDTSPLYFVDDISLWHAVTLCVTLIQSYGFQYVLYVQVLGPVLWRWHLVQSVDNQQFATSDSTTNIIIPAKTGTWHVGTNYCDIKHSHPFSLKSAYSNDVFGLKTYLF